VRSLPGRADFRRSYNRRSKRLYRSWKVPLIKFVGCFPRLVLDVWIAGGGNRGGEEIKITRRPAHSPATSDHRHRMLPMLSIRCSALERIPQREQADGKSGIRLCSFGKLARLKGDTSRLPEQSQTICHGVYERALVTKARSRKSKICRICIVNIGHLGRQG
jgi:hypothetical protein